MEPKFIIFVTRARDLPLSCPTATYSMSSHRT
jgi:hypothetical protein